MVSPRAQNFLNDALAKKAAFLASDATLLYVCPAKDEAADEVAAKLATASYETKVIDGVLYAGKTGAKGGDKVFISANPGAPIIIDVADVAGSLRTIAGMLAGLGMPVQVKG